MIVNITSDGLLSEIHCVYLCNSHFIYYI